MVRAALGWVLQCRMSDGVTLSQMSIFANPLPCLSSFECDSAPVSGLRGLSRAVEFFYG